MAQQLQPKIGIITALPKEYVAVKVLLDNFKPFYTPDNKREYGLGEIPAVNGGKHRVVLALAVDMGNNTAAIEVTLLLKDFPTVETVLMVGIAGGVPNPHKAEEHVRLGDVVVSNHDGVVQNDLVKRGKKTTHRHRPRPPQADFLRAARQLQARELEGERPWLKFIERAIQRLPHTARPSSEPDILVDSVNQKEVVNHPPDLKRLKDQPRIFFGPIASANTLLKNAVERDALRDKFGVKAVEMEGSGIADATWSHEKGYLVVRGICDYCDSNKNDVWQEYAAVVAAAYTRALLESMPGSAIATEKRDIHSNLEVLDDISSPPDIKKLIAKYSRRLQKLKEVQAVKGISVDPSVLIEIEDIEAKLSQLRELKSKPVLVKPGKKLSNVDPDPSPPLPQPLPLTSPPRPSWVLPLNQPPPLPYSGQINNAILKGYSLFYSSRAEQELGFLFGEVGCFWSGHPVYMAVSATSAPQIILAKEGGGKTALAYALAQIGNVNGHWSQTLPVLLTGRNFTLNNLQRQFAESLLNYVSLNRSLFTQLNQAEKRFLLRLLIDSLGVDLVRSELASALDSDENLVDVTERAPQRIDQAFWPQQAQHCLRLLGFSQSFLVIDCSQGNKRGVKSLLERMQFWANYSLIIKLFLPDEPEWERISKPFEPLRLTWSEPQLADLTQWRSGSLARLAGTHYQLQALFDEEAHCIQFMGEAHGNPGRLARLWDYLFEDHRTYSPDSFTFSIENLRRAIEKLNDSAYS